MIVPFNIGEGLCDCAGRRPFGAPLQRDLEAGSLQGSDIVTQGRMKHPTCAVIDRHHDRFMFPRAPLFGFGICGCQDRNVFGRASEFAVDFIRGMHPFLRKSFYNRMLGLADLDDNGNPRAMCASPTGGGIFDPFTFAESQHGP